MVIFALYNYRLPYTFLLLPVFNLLLTSTYDIEDVYARGYLDALAAPIACSSLSSF